MIPDNDKALISPKVVGAEQTVRHICLSEDERHMAGQDPRLSRSGIIPSAICSARRFMGGPKPAAEAGGGVA
ncbi:hypothetical protein [Roseomonas marmotae]|uniref:Uncharacterized protein n=1 Tax=Roseomonas marmotae TaxID=2768161 RepID=A0ABS3KI24_9PROT|nr:hypothetical protein [Roseomonas marmotae]MBO1077104.1 hypothetical protein [Roseomonas marmotae]QTI81370.1 hypothetical protein IAI58_18615 [Roseomonas marmotae]